VLALSAVFLFIVTPALAYEYPVLPYTPGSYNGRSFYYDGDHLGEDIQLSEGTPIEAIGPGTIKFYGPQSNPDIGYGELVVVIEHDLGADYTFTNAYSGSVTTRYILSIYGHLRDSATRGGTPTGLQAGDAVYENTVIGFVNDDAHNGDGAEHLHMADRQ
jgi:murein DD-endopeptidase MepM/ murein hydrolase activator NlpD